MIIDTHTHLERFLETKGGSAKDLAASMDAAGIDISLVVASRFGDDHGSGDKSYGPDAEELVEITRTFPGLRVIGNVDYAHFGNEQLKKLQKLIGEKSIVGIKCYIGYERYYPNDEKLHSLYRFCSENGIPVIYHTGYLLSGSRGMLKYSHPLSVDDVATMFPDLKIVIAHIGNPWIADCAAVVEKNKNVYMDLSGQFTEHQPISEKDKTDFRERMSVLNSLSGVRKCMFGSDWWFYSQKECLEVVGSIPMTSEERELIFWKNAAMVFNLQKIT